MKILAMDTSTGMCSLAIRVDGQTVHESCTAVNAGHSGSLLAGIDSALREHGLTPKALDMIAVGLGPGSFTGIRIGLATAKGLASALHCRLAGYCTLDILASGARPSEIPMLPLIDARKGEVFCALYDECANRQSDLMNIRPENLGTLVTGPTLLLGSGLEPYSRMIADICQTNAILAPTELWHPRASIMARLAEKDQPPSDFNSIQPIYVRQSDAMLAIGR